MADLVNVSELDDHAICMLAQAEKRNPISAAMRAALKAALENLRAKPAIKSIVITGGGSAFCSGMDLEMLAAQAALAPEEHLADARSIREFFDYITNYPKPTIAAVNGPAVAGGCGLALLCDITLASAAATFTFSEVKIGFVPAIVGVHLERMIGPKRARDLLFTARTIDAEEAQRLGLVNEVVPAEGLMGCAAVVCGLISKNSAQAVQSTKTLMAEQSILNLQQALDLAVELNVKARRSSDCQEGVRAFLEKRSPRW